jgi:hypothetical protein
MDCFVGTSLRLIGVRDFMRTNPTRENRKPSLIAFAHLLANFTLWENQICDFDRNPVPCTRNLEPTELELRFYSKKLAL